ncbi:hypothetical protein [Nocardioides sp. B-3]|uniref:hypothetical protein n=1 Tax=Nocardioides sp. B-3 TaxID=2895565 RepID=UPI00215288F4|nr:hypothetical protein [Nocardioides sp. B-3]UUZ58638.1 hypothetical protein LP418_21290 [Nocardioides sp. B-3]
MSLYLYLAALSRSARAREDAGETIRGSRKSPADIDASLLGPRVATAARAFIDTRLSEIKTLQTTATDHGDAARGRAPGPPGRHGRPRTKPAAVDVDRPQCLPDGRPVMTTIMLPAHVSAVDELDATADASTVTTALRSTATTLSDVSEWMTAHGAPADWTGDASEAAAHAMTRVAGATDGARAAFARVAVACDRYVDRIVALTGVRDGLADRRTRVNGDIDALALKIEAVHGRRPREPASTGRSPAGPGRPAHRGHHEALGRRGVGRGHVDGGLPGRRQQGRGAGRRRSRHHRHRRPAGPS